MRGLWRWGEGLGLTLGLQRGVQRREVRQQRRLAARRPFLCERFCLGGGWAGAVRCFSGGGARAPGRGASPRQLAGRGTAASPATCGPDGGWWGRAESSVSTAAGVHIALHDPTWWHAGGVFGDMRVRAVERWGGSRGRGRNQRDDATRARSTCMRHLFGSAPWPSGGGRTGRPRWRRSPCPRRAARGNGPTGSGLSRAGGRRGLWFCAQPRRLLGGPRKAKHTRRPPTCWGALCALLPHPGGRGRAGTGERGALGRDS